MMEENNKSLAYDVAAAIILDPKNRILLQKKDSMYAPGPCKWCLWGGQIEGNETAEGAIRREIKEELGGITIKEISPFGNFFCEGLLEGKNIKIHHRVFIIKFDGDLKKITLGEGAGFSLFEKSELQKLDILSFNTEILKKFIHSEN